MRMLNNLARVTTTRDYKKVFARPCAGRLGVSWRCAAFVREHPFPRLHPLSTKHEFWFVQSCIDPVPLVGLKRLHLPGWLDFRVLYLGRRNRVSLTKQVRLLFTMNSLLKFEFWHDMGVFSPASSTNDRNPIRFAERGDSRSRHTHSRVLLSLKNQRKSLEELSCINNHHHCDRITVTELRNCV
jgi:hypothetical protein